jgi:hypothetical protein
MIHPVNVCIELWKFILSQNYTNHQQFIQKVANYCWWLLFLYLLQMCGSLLPTSVEVKTRDREKFTISVKRKLYKENLNVLPFVNPPTNLSEEEYYTSVSRITRKLRLRTKESNHFQFHPELVKEVGKKRIKEFLEVYQPMYLSSQMREQMNFITEHLPSFGYTLKDFQPFGRNVFDRWELIKQYPQKY